MVTVEVGSKDYNVSKEKKSEDYVILKTEGSTAYIALILPSVFSTWNHVGAMVVSPLLSAIL